VLTVLLNAARLAVKMRFTFTSGKIYHYYNGNFLGYHVIFKICTNKYLTRLRIRSFQVPKILFSVVKNGGFDKQGNTHSWSIK